MSSMDPLSACTAARVYVEVPSGAIVLAPTLSLALPEPVARHTWANKLFPATFNDRLSSHNADLRASLAD